MKEKFEKLLSFYEKGIVCKELLNAQNNLNISFLLFGGGLIASIIPTMIIYLILNGYASYINLGFASMSILTALSLLTIFLLGKAGRIFIKVIKIKKDKEKIKKKCEEIHKKELKKLFFLFFPFYFQWEKEYEKVHSLGLNFVPTEYSLETKKILEKLKNQYAPTCKCESVETTDIRKDEHGNYFHVLCNGHIV